VHPEHVGRTPARRYGEEERQPNAGEDAAHEHEGPAAAPARTGVVRKPAEQRIGDRVEETVEDHRHAELPLRDVEEEAKDLERDRRVEPMAPHVGECAEAVADFLRDGTRSSGAVKRDGTGEEAGVSMGWGEAMKLGAVRR